MCAKQNGRLTTAQTGDSEPDGFACAADVGRHLAINTEKMKKNLKRDISFNSKRKSIVK